MSAGIRFEGVTKRFGLEEAVRDLNLDVEAGTRLALLGPSGCGKTTTMRMLAGIETPDAGRIEIGGRVVNDPRSLVPPARRRIGMVFQSLALWPHMTVERNLRFVRDPAGDPEKVDRLLSLVGLEKKAGAYPFELSGGQKQRVALARALVTEPEVLLMDEPMANLDGNLKRGLLESIRSIQEEFKVTMIYVTHDQMEALSVAEVLAVMHEGKVRQIGRPLDVYYKPADAFIAGFMGRANIMTGRVEGGRFICAAGDFPAEASRNFEEASAVLRAEDVSLRPDPEGRLTVKSSGFQGGRYIIELLAGDQSLVAESREPHAVGARMSAEALRPLTLLP